MLLIKVNSFQTLGGGGGIDATKDLNPLLFTNDCVYSFPINGAHLLAIKANSDVEMTDNGKSTKVYMVNESQGRTFIINDKTYEIQSCV